MKGQTIFETECFLEKKFGMQKSAGKVRKLSILRLSYVENLLKNQISTSCICWPGTILSAHFYIFINRSSFDLMKGPAYIQFT